MRLAWPLTGRAEELDAVHAALAAPSVAGILIAGAAGVGKSRMAREVLESVASDGATVRWVGATSSGRQVPLGAFARWMDGDCPDSMSLVRSVVENVTQHDGDDRVVIGIDDVDLLDDLSTFVVHQIIHRDAARVILTMRTGNPIPEATQDLWRGGMIERLDLQALSVTETEELVRAALGGPVDALSTNRLWTLTRGNALFLRNIVDREVTDGRLRRENGTWRWVGDPVIPPGLTELVEARMQGLSAQVRDVVDLLAVGEPIELAALTRMTSAEAVETAEIHGLVSVGGRSEEVRLAHPLYGEVRRRTVAASRLRRLRGVVANHLATLPDAGQSRGLVRRACLELESDVEPDAGLLLRAAEGAVWMIDLDLAERIAAAAVAAGAGPAASVLHAYVLCWTGRADEADHVLAIALSDDRVTSADRAELTFMRTLNMLFALSDRQGAKAAIDQAAAACVAGERDSLDAASAVYWASAGRPAEARAAMREVDLEKVPALVARSLMWAATTAAGEAGSVSEAVAAAESGYPLPVRGFLVITDAHASAAILAGRIREAALVAEHLHQRNVDQPSMYFRFLPGALSGRAALAAGDIGGAVGWLSECVPHLRAVGELVGWADRYELAYATALILDGRAGDAAAILEATRAERHPALQNLDYEYGIAHAHLAAAEGAVSQAVATSLTASRRAREAGQFAAEVMCLQLAVQLGDASAVERLSELRDVVEGPRVEVALRFAEAVRARDADALIAVSHDFERMGDLVAALDAAALAAVNFRAADRRGSAFGAQTRAEELAARGGGVRTSTLGRATERLPFSLREREVVMLLAQGLANRAIADRLTVSVRTVEGHIYRAMAKTGARTREELAAMVPASSARIE